LLNTQLKIQLKYPFFKATVCSAWDKEYRYGFNSMEKDNEINVNGGSYDFGARIYDSRLGRWLSLDGFERFYPSMSAYSNSLNNPIFNLDYGGCFITGHLMKIYEDMCAVLQAVDGGDIFMNLVQIDFDAMRFKKISLSDFEKALSALGNNEDAKAFIKGYYEAINSPNEYNINFISDDESFESILKDASPSIKEKYANNTGKYFDTNDGFGGTTIYDKDKNTTFIIINNSRTYTLNKSMKYKDRTGRWNYTLPWNCIVSSQFLFYTLWQRNEGFIEESRDKNPKAEQTLIDKLYAPKAGVHDVNGILYRTEIICKNLMQLKGKDKHISPPAELLPNSDKKKNKKEKKDNKVKILTPPFMNRKDN
jgi:RHS repeat-associated protein